jgi:hypothetical protein
MAFNDAQSKPITAPGADHVDTDGTPWLTTRDKWLVTLSQQNTIEEIQARHFPTFTTTQLREILLQARVRLKEPQSTNTTQRKEASTHNSDSNSDGDEVVDDGFAVRRKGEPTWQGTTTPWEHRGKPGIGWLPVEERPDMETFLRENTGKHKDKDKEKDV